MKKQIRFFAVSAAVFLIVFFFIFVFNQSMQFYGAAAGVHPTMGVVVLVFLAVFYGLIVLLPIWFFVRLPKRVKPPKDVDSDAYETYLHTIKKRMTGNPALQHVDLSNEQDVKTYVEKATKVLDEQTAQLVKDTAGFVFVSTAISQNGVFDGVIVLISQLRMVWKVAHLYHQSPSLKEVLYLYANVAATALVVKEIDDFEIIEDQLEPVLASVIGGSLAGVVPGLNRLSTVLINSIIQGSANAFLTLRVGMIAKKYCGMTLAMDKSAIRRSSGLEACKLLGQVLSKSVKTVAKSIGNAGLRATKAAGAAGKHEMVSFATDSKLRAQKIMTSLAKGKGKKRPVVE